jgi:uncharacterized protein (TIGR00730 family)
MHTNASSGPAELLKLSEPVQAVTVFLSSARDVDRHYFDIARDMGRCIARRNWRLIYGGNYVGCMAALADGAREGGGKVTGITPRLFVDQNLADTLCDELIITDSMRDRKHLMEQRADAFIALPGGIGTLEELFEIIVAKQLGYHHKPIVLLNINGFYSPLLDLINNGIRLGFMRQNVRSLYVVADTVEQAVWHLASV